MPLTIGVVGLSHLGLVWSLGYASLGFKVIGFDTDTKTVADLNNGIIPVAEPKLPELLKEHRSSVTFSSNPTVLKECSVVYCAKDVAMDEEGKIDLAEIDTLLGVAIPHLRPQVEFIFMGQVPVGYTRKIGDRIRTLRPGFPFNLTYCVETVSIGTAVENFLRRQYTILGTSESQSAAPLVQEVLKPFNSPTICISYESAELAKGGINILLASQLSFVNTLSELCERYDANVHEVVAAMKLDKRFSPTGYWRPGLGFAGGHFERDLSTWTRLSEEAGLEPKFLKTLVACSKERHQWLVKILERYVLNNSKRPTIGLWGLAYKKGTESTHNAHCLRVIRDFASRATLKVYDPAAILPSSVASKVEICKSKEAVLENADGLVILTEWDEFATAEPDLFLKKMRRPIIIDCVNILPHLNDKRLTCISIGKPLPPLP